MLRSINIYIKLTIGLLLMLSAGLSLTRNTQAAGTYRWLSGPAIGTRTTEQTDFNNNSPSTSADGRYIAYVSRKADLVTNVIDGQPHAYLYDQSSGKSEMIAVDSSNTPLPGTTVAGGQTPISISANGRYIAYQQRVTISGVTTFPLYVRDNLNKTTVPASISSQGANINSGDALLGISNNGMLLFSYSDTQPIVNNPYANSFLYIRDTVNQTTTQVPQLSGFSGWSITEPWAEISADGSTLVVLLKDNLHQGQGLHIGLIKTTSWAAENISASIDSAIQSSNVNQPLVRSMSQNGRFAVMQIFSLYIWDDQLKSITPLSITDTPQGYAVTDDGRYIASKIVDHTNNSSPLRFNLSLLDRSLNTAQVIVPATDVDPDGNLATYTFAPSTGQFVFDTAQSLDTNDSIASTYDLYESTGTPLRLDSTPPSISASLSPQSNTNGWNNTNVTVSFACSDSSGIASCSGPTTLTNEGAGQTVTGTATDNAGNTASATATVNIDKTAPTINYSVSSAPSSNGWNSGDVTVTFNCSDVLSGIKSCTSPVTINTEGGNQTVTGTATDKAGNTRSVTATINIDKTAPTINYIVTPAPNINGWNQDNVTITFLCDDSLSQIDTCSDSVNVSSEDANQTVTGTAVDKAGNTATVTAAVNLDKTAPTINTSSSPSANSNGWNKSDVTVSFACNDALSGIKSCTSPVTISSEGANQTVAGTATDKAGNTANVTATLNLDKTAPTINYSVSPAPNANGWSSGDVIVSFTCNDSLSGIDVCPSPITINTEGGNQTVTGTATDKAGNSKSVTVTINTDKTAPTINYLTTPAPNINGWNQDNVTITFLCDDSLSGIASCSIPVTVSAEGANQTVTGTAVDKAGNTATVTATVNLDKTAPTINYSASPAPNAHGWNNGDVTVPFTCNDTLSGLDSCSNPTTVSSEGANQAVTGTATDKAGNTTAVTATVSIDKTAPSISYIVSPTPNSNGWNSSNVTVSFTCSDSLSGIDVCPGPVTLSEGAGQIITGTATDKAGNSASTSVMVNVDKTAPVVSALNWTANPLQQGQNTTLMATASDGLSGVNSVSYSINGGTPQPMTYDPISGNWIVTLGSSLAANTYNITVFATDAAGNTSSGTNDVLAVYTTANGYVTGHADVLPSTSDTMPIALDTSNHPAKLVLGFTNVMAPTSGSFDLDYAIKNKQNEFSLSSTVINWVVIQDSTHSSILGHADLTTYVNGVMSVTQNVAVRYDIALGTNGAADHVTVKIFNPGVDPNSGTPAYVISDSVVANGSNLMIHP